MKFINFDIKNIYQDIGKQKIIKCDHERKIRLKLQRFWHIDCNRIDRNDDDDITQIVCGTSPLKHKHLLIHQIQQTKK